MKFKNLISKLYKFWKHPWGRWFILISIAVQLPGTSGETPILYLILMWLFMWPLIKSMGAIYKTARFFYIPSPRQIWKGLKITWPAVSKGPVVTRVHRPKSPPTP